MLSIIICMTTIETSGDNDPLVSDDQGTSL